MGKIIIIIGFVCAFLSANAQNKIGVIKQTQLNYPNVKAVYDKYWASIQDSMKQRKIDPEKFQVFFRVFKYEKELEIWIKNVGDTRFQLFKTFLLCATSGDLGPKKYNKDGQIPEGFYELTTLMPKDKYKYLAIKLNFPNQADKANEKESLTANVFLNGTCETVADIVIDKEDMAQLYILCVEAKNRKEYTYMDIYPCKFNKANNDMLNTYPSEKTKFWKNIKDAYLFFEEHHWLPKVHVNGKGQYIYEE